MDAADGASAYDYTSDSDLESDAGDPDTESSEHGSPSPSSMTGSPVWGQSSLRQSEEIPEEYGLRDSLCIEGVLK